MKQAVRGNFDESVPAYDAYERHTRRFATLSRLLYAEMVARLDDRPAVVVDAGAGSGASTAVFRESDAAPVAVDISREMLLENDASARVQGDIDALPLCRGTADAVAFTASLFLVPDPGVAVREAARVLRPGGVVGAVAPVGWFDADGRDVFDSLDRESRSPTDHRDVAAALESVFRTDSGTWRFATAAEDVRLFHAIPAIAARLYPEASPTDRVRKAEDLLAALVGTVEERWRWTVGRLPQ